MEMARVSWDISPREEKKGVQGTKPKKPVYQFI
jgi:hypothetical protein